MPEKFRAKGRKLYFGFVDLGKAFDRVPREDCEVHKLNRDNALDRNRWRKLIGMIDDYDESSG